MRVRQSAGAKKKSASRWGVVVEADLVGFTPLAAAMTRAGPGGIERLHALLDGLFAEMTRAVEERGGSVVAFAGDALTAVFVDDAASDTDSADPDCTARDRALRAARDLLAVTDPTWAAGEQAPAFRVGLGWGRIRRATFVDSGDSERAGRRYELLSGSAVDAAQAARERAPIGAGSASWTTRALTATARRRLAAPAPDATLRAQHRVVTTAFVHVGEVPAAGSRALLTEVSAIVARHQGDLRQIDGTGPGYTLVLGFGAPRSHPEDVAHAVGCCLELIELARQRRLAARAGVATGETFCAELGGPGHHEYVVVGDSVNHAARLAASAQAHEIRVDRDTARGCAGTSRFATASLGELALKGRVLEEAFTVVPPTPAAPEWHPPVERRGVVEGSVGRDAEIAQLRRLGALTCDGPGHVVMLTGEPGRGKTHLLRLLAAHQPEPVVEGCGDALGDRTAYLAWRSVWRSLLAQLAGLPASAAGRIPASSVRDGLPTPDRELAPLLATALGIPMALTPATRRLSPADRAGTTRRLLLDLLERACLERGPVTILLDDAAHLDELSGALLTEVARATRTMPVFLVVASREPVTWLTAPGIAVQRIELAPLEPGATRSLAARLLGPDHPRLAAVAARSGGNPLFLHHLARWADEQPGDEALPGDIRRVVLARLDRLESSGQALLQAAAVAGREFSLSMLRACVLAAGIDPGLGPRLAALAGQGLLRPRPGGADYEFTDPLVHDVAYATMSLAVRARLHEAAGDSLEPWTGGLAHAPELDLAAPLELLAYHYGRSRNTAKQRRWIGAAALAAERDYATGAALTHLRRLATIEQGATRAGLRVRQAWVLALLGRREEAHELLGEVLRAPAGQAGEGDPELERLQARARRDLGALLLPTARFGEGIALLARAAAELTNAGDLDGAAQALDRLAFAHLDHGELAQAERAAHRQHDLAIRCGREALIAAASANLSLVALARGDADGALAQAREAHRRAVLSQDRRLLVHTGNDLAGRLLEHGDLAQAAEHIVAALEIARSIGYRAAEATLTGNLGELHRTSGDPRTATALTVRALRAALDLGDCPTVARCTVNLATNLATNLAASPAGQGPIDQRRREALILVERAARIAGDLDQDAWVQDALAAARQAAAGGQAATGGAPRDARAPRDPGRPLPRPADLASASDDLIESLIDEAEQLARAARAARTSGQTP